MSPTASASPSDRLEPQIIKGELNHFSANLLLVGVFYQSNRNETRTHSKQFINSSISRPSTCFCHWNGMLLLLPHVHYSRCDLFWINEAPCTLTLAHDPCNLSCLKGVVLLKVFFFKYNQPTQIPQT